MTCQVSGWVVSVVETAGEWLGRLASSKRQTSAGGCRGCVRGPGAAVDVDASGGSNKLPMGGLPTHWWTFALSVDVRPLGGGHMIATAPGLCACIRGGTMLMVVLLRSYTPDFVCSWYSRGVGVDRWWDP